MLKWVLSAPCGDLKIDALAGEKLHVALGRIGLYHLEVLHGGIAVPFLPLESDVNVDVAAMGLEAPRSMMLRGRLDW